jgi:hypothetical protein
VRLVDLVKPYPVYEEAGALIMDECVYKLQTLNVLWCTPQLCFHWCNRARSSPVNTGQASGGSHIVLILYHADRVGYSPIHAASGGLVPPARRLEACAAESIMTPCVSTVSLSVRSSIEAHALLWATYPVR